MDIKKKLKKDIEKYTELWDRTKLGLIRGTFDNPEYARRCMEMWENIVDTMKGHLNKINNLDHKNNTMEKDTLYKVKSGDETILITYDKVAAEIFKDQCEDLPLIQEVEPHGVEQKIYNEAIPFRIDLSLSGQSGEDGYDVRVTSIRRLPYTGRNLKHPYPSEALKHLKEKESVLLRHRITAFSYLQAARCAEKMCDIIKQNHNE